MAIPIPIPTPDPDSSNGRDGWAYRCPMRHHPSFLVLLTALALLPAPERAVADDAPAEKDAAKTDKTNVGKTKGDKPKGDDAATDDAAKDAKKYPPKGVAPNAKPENLGFETGAPGKAPDGWIVPKSATDGGFTAELTTVAVHGGKQAVLVSGSPAKADSFGSLVQKIDAKPYRGQVIRFRAFVKAGVSWDGRAQLWLRVDRPGKTLGFFDNMDDRPISTTDWKAFEIIGTVAADAEVVNLGVILVGSGKVWLDDVEVTVLGPVPTPEPPRALAGRGLENLVAFTRLLGYVRFFHPSDEAAQTDWGAFAIAGVRAIEGATTPKAEAAALEALFAPVAPTVRVYVGDAAHAPKPPTASPRRRTPRM